jgi:prolipoprotein diacylglyceryltransferase
MALTFPVYLDIGGFKLHPHVVLELAAYAVGFRLYLAARRRSGDVVDARTRWSVIAAAILGAGIGSRVLFWFENPALTAAHWSDVSYLLSGKTVVGALIGGLIGVEIVKHVIGVRRRTGDLFAVPLAVGIAIGRVGCFLTGLEDQTYGSPSQLRWAVDFGDGVTRHPVQLYESVFAAVLALWLSRLNAGPHREGSVFRHFMVAYMAWRVAVDSLKPELRVVAGLSSLQIAALGVLVYYAVIGRRRLPGPDAEIAVPQGGLR